MHSDRPAPLLVEQVRRELPGDHPGLGRDVPPPCAAGVRFVDELFRERRISSVEWEVLRAAIWPRDARTGEAILEVRSRRTGTRPACPSCKLLMERVTTPWNHDRPAVTFFRCTSCGVEDCHEVETLRAGEAV